MLANKEGANEEFTDAGNNNIIIKAENVRKDYPNITALENISFSSRITGSPALKRMCRINGQQDSAC